MTHALRLVPLLLLCVASLGLTPAQQKQLDVKLTIHGRPEHPTVYLSKADIEQARLSRERYAWAMAAAEKLLAEADRWAAKSDDDLVKLIPPPASCFAYGFTGCPVCGSPFADRWGAGGVASLDDPGFVKCPKGHRLPDTDHPDAGDGWTDKDGKKFYFVGTYNSFVIDTLTTALTRLVHAYALTGDARYAHKAAVVLDNLARIYPTCTKGSWDYPSNPPRGRFNRPWYQVARMLVFYVDDYDILMSGNELDQPSSVAGLTRRQNIEQNMLLDGAKFCHEMSVTEPSLTNGMADYIRGQLAVGAAMGIPEYIAWGVDGPYGIRAMLANNVDRDGQYYETSSLYSDHARNLYCDMAEILQRYTDAAHPDGIELVKDPAFLSYNVLGRTRVSAAGLEPNLGDDGPKPKHIATTRAVDPYDFRQLEHVRALNADPALATRLDAALGAAVGGDIDDARASSKDGEWLLFHAKELDAAAAPTTQPLVHPLTGTSVDESDLLTQRGLAILRNGNAGDDPVAATLRGGPTLNHGHVDELGLQVYFRGNELTYDIGYLLGSTHTQVGWAHTTASHNTVLVDETPQLEAGVSGGSVEQFVHLPGFSLVTMNDAMCYTSQKVRRYARTVAMVDVSPGQSYLLDVFRVEGGQKHDYVFHARGTDVTFDGVQFAEPRRGSLAGPNIDWAAKLGSDGDVEGVSNKPYWNPPPGNGLGFLPHPRTAAAPTQPWSATWNVDPKTPARLKLTMLPMEGELVTAAAPGNYPHLPKAQYILARRSGENLTSTFASIVEPFGDPPAVAKVTPLNSSDDAVAVRVDLPSGRRDYLIHREPGSSTRTWSDGGTSIEFDGRFALVRCRPGSPDEAVAIGGTVLKFQGLELYPAPEVQGTIERVDYERNILYTKALLPKSSAGQFLYISNPGYSQSSPYRIGSVSTEGGVTAIHLAPTRLVLARGHMTDAPADAMHLPNVTPLEYAKSVKRKWSGFFAGKTVATPDGRATTRIRRLDKDGMVMTVDSSTGFRAGDDLVIYDVRPGDQLRLPGFSQIPAPPEPRQNDRN